LGLLRKLFVPLFVFLKFFLAQRAKKKEKNEKKERENAGKIMPEAAKVRGGGGLLCKHTHIHTANTKKRKGR
jgi:hypothetical protein